MTKEQIDHLVSTHLDKLAPEYIEPIRQRLAEVDEGTGQAAFAGMKSPGAVMVFIAWFAGGLGVDRFMLGDTGLGIAKLLTCGGCGIWSLIDIFTVNGRTRKYNGKKVLSMLGA